MAMEGRLPNAPKGRHPLCARPDRFAQHLQRSGPRQFRGLGIERRAPGAVEAVLRALVHEDLGVGATRECAADLVPYFGGDRGVLRTEVKLDWALDRLRLAEESVDAAALVS